MAEKALQIKSTARDVLIYGLFDNSGIRYVGKTCSALNTRLSSHLCASNLRYKSHKNCWIKKMLSEGRKPEIRLLETVPAEHEHLWPTREQAWISFGHRIGWDLTNTSIGGDAGPLGVKHTDETKRKMSEAHKRHIVEHPERLDFLKRKRGKYSEAHRKALSLAQQKRFSDPAERAKLSAQFKGIKKRDGFSAKCAERQKRLCENPDYVKSLSEAGKKGSAARWGNAA